MQLVETDIPTRHGRRHRRASHVMQHHTSEAPSPNGSHLTRLAQLPTNPAHLHT